MPATKNFHLPLTIELHHRLKKEAKLEQIPATHLVRTIIENWFRQKEREKIAKEIRAFACDFAETTFDLDPELESAGIDSILDASS